MNILDLIKDDHRRAREVIRRLLAGGETPEAAQRLFGGLRNMLERHMDVEEGCLYSVVDPQDDEVVDEAAAEHEGIYELLGAIDESTPGSDAWREGLEDLEEMFEAHVDMEESEIFALARRTLSSERLTLLGAEFRSRTQGGERGESRRGAEVDPYVRE